MDTHKCCSHGRVQLTAPCRIWTQILSSDWQDMAQYWYIAVSYTDGLDTALFCCWTKHCHISLPLWQLLKIKQTLKFFAEGDFNRRKKAEIMGYWNWIFTVQNRAQICFVRLEFDSHTLHTEPPIHVGTETWITGWRPTKWSNSESPHFHAFKIPNTKLMT